MSGMDFDWEAVTHKSVASVMGRNQRRMSDGTLAWDAIAFVIGHDAVLLTVTADTDEILVAHAPAPEDEGWAAVTALEGSMGKALGWCWIGTNYRGYRDSFTLAFGDAVPRALQPRLTFVAEACSLCCFDVMPTS